MAITASLSALEALRDRYKADGRDGVVMEVEKEIAKVRAEIERMTADSTEDSVKEVSVKNNVTTITQTATTGDNYFSF